MGSPGVVLLLSLAAAVAQAQTPPGPGHIEGTVLNAVTGQPVRKARLSLILVAGQPGALRSEEEHWKQAITGSTDSQGKYNLSVPTSGGYRLTVHHDGYMGQVYGASKPGEEQKGTVLELGPGSSKTKADVSMTPFGAIMGHVLDEYGDPVRQVEVAAMTYVAGPNGKTLQQQSGSQTDALGEYRIFDLPPGRYYLRARPMSAQMPGADPTAESYAVLYYPSGMQPTAATPIALTSGQEQQGIDFALHPTESGFLRGRVIKPDGAASCRVFLEGGGPDAPPDMSDAFSSTVIMVTTSGNAASFSPEDFEFPGSQKTGKDGKFEFPKIPAGSHTVTAICIVGKQRYTAKSPVQLVTPGLDNLLLHPAPPSTITGKVAVEGQSNSKIADTRLGLEEHRDNTVFGGQAGADAPDGSVGEDGAFRFRDLAPGVYHLGVEPPDGLYLKSVTIGGRVVSESVVDLSDGAASVEVNILLSANGATVEGAVENGAGAEVTLIPAGPQLARGQAKEVTADPDGHFSFSALAPGRYTLFAWEHVDTNTAFYDADFRKPFETSGQTVDLEEGRKVNVRLKLIPASEK
ncbi:MAG TPA: carboxypeptidase-like regulatory domain-containing protein [Bryobacteraceae bacterium]|nr:carboxypeptidase-like regulatory domain-containing protein [Bryobacteraceae bacterium]